MSKLTKIITSTLFFAIGAGVTFFSVSALLKASDWITIIIYGSAVIVGLVFVAIGWAAAKGEDIKTCFEIFLVVYHFRPSSLDIEVV